MTIRNAFAAALVTAAALVSPAVAAPAAALAPVAPAIPEDDALALALASSIGCGISRAEHAANRAAVLAAQERAIARTRRNQKVFRALCVVAVVSMSVLLLALIIGRLF